MSGPFIRPKATKANGLKIPHVIVEGAPETVRIDDTGTHQYFGYAPLASDESVAVWKISRLTNTNPQALVWADGDSNYDNVWANRASLTYA